MSIRTQGYSKRWSDNYRLQQNSSFGPGMLKDEGSKHTEPHIALRYVTKGFDSQDINISSLDTMDMGALDHMMKPIFLASPCSLIYIVMPAAVTFLVAVELKRICVKLEI
jgi:hypothetical protein